MTRRRPASLLWQLGGWLVFSQLLVVVVVGRYFYVQARRQHHDQAQHRLQQVMPMLAAHYASVRAAGDEGLLDAAAKADGLESDVRVTIVESDGRVIADSGTDPATMENHRYRPEIDDALARGDGSATRFSRTFGLPMMYVARRIDVEPGQPIVVRAAVPMAQISADLRRITLMGVAIGTASTLLVCAVIWLLSRRLHGHLRLLAERASRLVAGTSGPPIPSPTVSELSPLATSLNEMGRQFGDRIGQLQVQQNEYRAILQSMSNGVIALDGTQRIVHLNRAAEALLGIESARARGRLLLEVIRQPELHRFVEAALDGAGRRPVELTLGGDRPRRVEGVAETLAGPDRGPAGLLIVLNDVTDLRRLESLRSDFAANVSHELRTPITNIKGYVETLLEVGWDDARQAAQFLEIIRKNSSRLASIVEDVMALSKLEQSEVREKLTRARVPITALVKSVRGEFAAAAEEKSITVEVDVEPGLAANIHGPMLEQALGNLLSNAIAYSPAGTVVRINARRSAEMLILEVRDEGPGIAAAHVPRLFERFYRVDKARSRESGGTGLGLAIVKHIALVHGGNVSIDTAPGKGSCFRISIPGSVAGDDSQILNTSNPHATSAQP